MTDALRARSTMFAFLGVVALTTLYPRPGVAEPDDSGDFLSDMPEWVEGVIGGRPWGTHIERLRHMSFAYSIQSPPGVSEVLTGFRYTERASAFAQLVAMASSGAAAQAEANRTRSTVTYEVPFDHDGTFGLSLEFAKSTSDDFAAGGIPFALAVGLDNITYLGRDVNDVRGDTLPITLRWGLIGKYWQAREVIPDPENPPDPDRFTGGGFFGISLDFGFPLTRWAQINAELNIGYPDVEVGLSGTVHLGNRFFVKAGSTTTLRSLGYFGTFLNLGVRL